MYHQVLCPNDFVEPLAKRTRQTKPALRYYCQCQPKYSAAKRTQDKLQDCLAFKG